MKIEKIGVIGAGQMGNGIAHVCALAGYDVVMEDINAEALNKATSIIERNLNRQAARGLITQAEADAAKKRIRIAGELNVMKDRDLVIEAATENELVKRKVFQELCQRRGRAGEAGREDGGQCRGLPRLHRQPHPAADDQ